MMDSQDHDVHQAHDTTLAILDYSLNELDRVNADNADLARALDYCIGKIERLCERNAVLRVIVRELVA